MKPVRALSWLIVLIPVLAFGGMWIYFRSNPSKPKISIYEAVAKGDVDAIERHVKTGTDLNAIVGGHTVLYRAASNADLKSVRALLAAGALPDGEMKGKTTPLQAAAQAGSLECVQALLEKGADVKAVNASGNTSLHFAATGGNPAIVKLFLDKGLDINARRKVDNATALCDAASQGRLACVQELVKRGAKIDVTGFSGRSPLILAAMSHRHDAAMELLKLGANPSQADDAKVMPIGYALFSGDEDLVRALIPVTKPANWRDRGGHGALFWAEEGRAPADVVDSLKRSGAVQ